ncbi:conserved hypothetical protein [Trichinella spiralis]|nr:conserved hypothetical protein [Trichinella spiralis]
MQFQPGDGLTQDLNQSSLHNDLGDIGQFFLPRLPGPPLGFRFWWQRVVPCDPTLPQQLDDDFRPHRVWRQASQRIENRGQCLQHVSLGVRELRHPFRWAKNQHVGFPLPKDPQHFPMPTCVTGFLILGRNSIHCGW